jgi:AraC family L-rhamnose operon transcriptional activator RhaR
MPDSLTVEFRTAAPAGSQIFVPGIRRTRAIDSRDHRHDFIELVHIVRGTGTQTIDDRKYPIISGDLYVLPIGSSHHSSADPDSELAYYDILFRPELFSTEEWATLQALPRFARLFAEARPGQDHPTAAKLTFAPPRSDEILGLIERMSKESLAAQPGWQMLVKGLFIDLLVTTCRYAEERVPDDVASQEGPVAKTLAFLHEHSHERLSVEDLAGISGVSSGYLGELFKSKTGESIHRYLMCLRVERAREMIEQSDRSFTQIALDCGFEDSSYFARVFRQIMGVSPRTFRKSLGTDRPSPASSTAPRPSRSG